MFFWRKANPECPDWYTSEWRVECNGTTIYPFSVYKDGDGVIDCNYFGNVSAIYKTEHEAIRNMYSLIKKDIEKMEMLKKRGKVVATWP